MGGRQPGQVQAQAERGQDRQGEAAGGPCPEGAGGCWWVAFLFRGPRRKPREKSIRLQEQAGWGLGEGEGRDAVGGAGCGGRGGGRIKPKTLLSLADPSGSSDLPIQCSDFRPARQCSSTTLPSPLKILQLHQTRTCTSNKMCTFMPSVLCSHCSFCLECLSSFFPPGRSYSL